MEEQIRANAEMVVQELRPLSDIDFGYTQESVKWLEGYIERLRNSGEFENGETKTRLISVFGSFLGECLVRCYGGTWKLHNGAWCVAFKKGEMAFPFAKVTKQIEYGLGGWHFKFLQCHSNYPWRSRIRSSVNYEAVVETLVSQRML